ncbi:MAG: penicillin-binding transpeptidase domain-containing protein [Candidatus Eisenbacteria bacterium]
MNHFGRKARMFVVVAAGLAVWVYLFIGLARIQLLDHDVYRERAARQHDRKVELPGNRGRILDRHGELLAGTLSSPTVIADPSQITDPNRVSRALAPILGLSAGTLRERLRRPGNFIYLARRVDPAVGESVFEADLEGVYCIPEKDRIRPLGDLALPLLGFTNVDNVGVEGAELQFDSVLRAEKGWRVLQAVPARGCRELPGGPCRPPVDGCDVVLTLDAGVQSVVDLELRRAVASNKAAYGMAMAMDPVTGDVLALSTAEGAGGEADRQSLNRCVVSQFEPGSTYKLVTYAAALDRGVVSPDDLFWAGRGKMNFGVYTIHDPKEYDTLTVRQGFELSSNVVTAQIAHKLGPEALYSYSRAFGFGALSGVTFPGELPGMLRRPKEWSGRSLGTVAIGHEVAVNLVQLVAAYGAVANDGVLMEPRLVREIRRPDGSVVERIPPRKVRRVISSETAALMVEFLHGAVTEGTGSGADLGIWPTAGKTGTAQYLEETGGFSHRRFTSSFIGFAPTERSRMVVAVVLVDISGVFYGGLVAAPIFRDILLKVACSDLAESFRGVLREEAVASWRLAEAAAPSARPPVSFDGAAPPLMPDLRGRLLREAKSMLLSAEASVNLLGAGVVAAQLPPPGAPLRPGAVCELVGSER